MGFAFIRLGDEGHWRTNKWPHSLTIVGYADREQSAFHRRKFSQFSFTLMKWLDNSGAKGAAVELDEFMAVLRVDGAEDADEPDIVDHLKL